MGSKKIDHYKYGYIGDFTMPKLGNDTYGNPLQAVNVLKWYDVSQLPPADELRYRKLAIVNSGSNDEIYICVQENGEYVWKNIMAYESSESEDIHEIREEIQHILEIINDLDAVTHAEYDPFVQETDDELDDHETRITWLESLMGSGYDPEDWIINPIVRNEDDVLTYDGSTWVASDRLTNLETIVQEIVDIFGSEFHPDNWILNPTDKEDGQVLTYNGTEWVAEDVDALPDVTEPGQILVSAETSEGVDWVLEEKFKPYLENTEEVIERRQLTIGGGSAYAPLNAGFSIDEGETYVLLIGQFLYDDLGLYKADAYVEGDYVILDFTMPLTSNMLRAKYYISGTTVEFFSRELDPTTQTYVDHPMIPAQGFQPLKVQLFHVLEKTDNVLYGDIYDAIATIKNKLYDTIENLTHNIHPVYHNTCILNGDGTSVSFVVQDTDTYGRTLGTWVNVYNATVKFYYNGVLVREVTYEDQPGTDAPTYTTVTTHFDFPMDVQDELTIEVIVMNTMDI